MAAEEIGASAESVTGGEPSGSAEVTTSEPSGNWTEGLGEDAQGYVENKGWSGAGQMLDSYRNLEKAMGAPADQIVQIPKDAEDTDGWNSVYSRMGRPETADGYKLSDTPVPDGAIDLTGDLKQWAHEAGLSQTQTAILYDRYNGKLSELVKEQHQQGTEMVQAEEAALKKEWGSAWDENIAAATRFRQRFGIDGETIDKLEGALGLKGVLELTAKIGRGLGEHAMPTGSEEDSGNGLAFGMTPGAAKAKIDELMLDKEFMGQYVDGRPQAVDRMTRLHSLAHPESE